MTPTLFLDIDGVLHTQESLRAHGTHAFHRPCIERLNVIVERTRCVIVISSSWRCNKSVEWIAALMVEHGFAFPESVVDETPTWRDELRESGKVILSAYRSRGEEIAAYIEANAIPRESVVILDDDLDTAPLLDRSVHVLQGMYRGGLQDEHVDRVIELCGGGR